MPARRPQPLPPALASQFARDPLTLLSASKSTAAARRVLAVLLLMADGNGIVTGYSRTIADAAGMEKGTAIVAMRRLRKLGEITTERQPVPHRPGMWKITALR